MKEVLVLQFGGPSKQGFLSYTQLRSIQDEMDAKGIGKFEGGKFTPTEDPSKAVDGYEALWEYKNGRKLEYPVPKYRHPLLLDSDAFSWQTVDQDTSEGVKIKPLGIFSDSSVSASFVQLQAGTLNLHPKKAIQLLFVCSGTAKVNGEDIREQSAVQLNPGEEAHLSAEREGAKVLHFTLPSFSA